MIHVRTLGIIELMDKHSAGNLKKTIETVLNNYRISISKIYSFTSDNGSNMVKLGKLLSDAQCLLGVEKLESDDLQENLEFPVLNTPEDWMPGQNTALINNIRCAAHTLQLAVDDALKNVPGITETMTKARKSAKSLRTPTIRKMLIAAAPRANKPKLDLVTRWHSTADMLESLMEVKDFFEEFSSSHKPLALTDIEWQCIGDYLKSLMPAKIAAKRLQDEQLTLGAFFGIWIECKVLTEEVDTSLAREVVKAMKKREEQLLDNDALLASVFLDPRFLPLLPKKYYGAAITELKQLWHRLEFDAKVVGSQLDHSQSKKSEECISEPRSSHINARFKSDGFRKMRDLEHPTYFGRI